MDIATILGVMFFGILILVFGSILVEKIYRCLTG